MGMRPRPTVTAVPIRFARAILLVVLLALGGCTQPSGPNASPAASPPAAPSPAASYGYGY